MIALLVFGPKRLPEMGRSLGRDMREFKDSLAGNVDDESGDSHTQADSQGTGELEQTRASEKSL